jgi:hypothetical protein
MADVETQIKAAIQHAGAVVLLWLQNAERGYTSLVASEPVVAQGVELAKAEAAARSVPTDEINVTPSQVLVAAQEMAVANADPYAVAAETKAPVAQKAVAEKAPAAVPGVVAPPVAVATPVPPAAA